MIDLLDNFAITKATASSIRGEKSIISIYKDLSTERKKRDYLH